jgi:trk system potassium uptake protein TrkH
MGHRMASRRLLGTVESDETLALTVRNHAHRTLAVYVVLTLVGLLVLWLLTRDGFTALLHVLSSVSTGGFAPHDDSLAGLRSRSVAVAVMAISLLGAIPLYLYWESAHAGWRRCIPNFSSDPELRALLLACVVTAGALVLLGWLNDLAVPWHDRVLTGVSAQTTTGFSTTAVADMDAASKVVLMISMLVGGSVGSSAGGFKILRLLILVRLLQLLLRRTAMPSHAVTEAHLAGEKLDADDASRALQLILLYALIVIASWLPFVASGYDPLDALFEVVSATGTVGLSTGIANPGLEAPLKLILCLDMLAGRVEIVALLVIMYPRTWWGRREKTS